MLQEELDKALEAMLAELERFLDPQAQIKACMLKQGSKLLRELGVTEKVREGVGRCGTVYEKVEESVGRW